MPSQVIITNVGQSEITNAITSSSKVFLKYFKFSAQDINPLDPTLTDLPGAWITKDINAWVIVDDNTIMLYCVVEPDEAVSQFQTVGIFDINNNLIAVGRRSDGALPQGIRQVAIIELQVSNLSSVIDFSYLPWNDAELELLLTQLATDTAAEFTNVYQELIYVKTELNDLETRLTTIETTGADNALTLDGHSADVNPTPNTIPIRDTQGRIFAKPASSTYQVVTLGQADSRYVNISGDRMTGTLKFATPLTSGTHIITNDNEDNSIHITSGTVELLNNISTTGEIQNNDFWSYIKVNRGNIELVVSESIGTAGNIISDLSLTNSRHLEISSTGFFLRKHAPGNTKTLLIDPNNSWVDFVGDTSFRFNRDIYVNANKVLTDLNLKPVAYKYTAHTTTVDMYIDFNDPKDIGFWIIFFHGVITDGSNATTKFLYIDGQNKASIYVGDWPDGTAPISFTYIHEVTSVPSSIHVTTSRWQIQHWAAIKFYSYLEV